MILTRKRLEQMLGLNIFTVYDALNGSSVDVTLDNILLLEDTSYKRVITLKKNKMSFTKWDLSEGYYVMPPGKFILGSIREHLDIPNNCSAVLFLDSGLARCGLEHSAATFLHPGWEGKLTLELKNISEAHFLKFEKDLPIGKIVFFEHDTTDPYKGSFNKQEGVKP